MRSLVPLALLAVLIAPGCTSPSVPPDAAAPGAPDDAAFDASDTADAGLCAAGAHALYPSGPFAIDDGAVLPDLRFDRGDGTPIAMHDYFDPCNATPRLLVVRVLAAWSGPARWHAAHTASTLRATAYGARINALDLLVLGQDNQPAVAADLADWRALYDVPPDALALDPAYEWTTLFLASGGLPIVVLVDPRTMRAVKVDVVPSSYQLDDDVRLALANLDAQPRPTLPPPALHDGRFSDDQWDLIRAMTPVPPPPPDPTNAHADDPMAAALGRALFSDVRLSPSGTVACASCHQPAMAFDDGRPVAVGVGTGSRNTPSVLFAAYSRWQFLDGRADSLWMQATEPTENPVEMNSDRLFVAHAIAQHDGAAYTAVFGGLPPLDDSARFPPTGRPGGGGAWDHMAAADQQAVNAVFANYGKALEAFERTLRARPAAIDAYAAGDPTALSTAQKNALAEFFSDGCTQCHYGPLLTDQSFHNVWMPTGYADGTPDPGRRAAIAQLLASPFRADGAFSDAPDARPSLGALVATDTMLGQFRTPSLRGTAAMGPWGHGGTFPTLRAVMQHYSRRGSMAPVAGTTGSQDIHLPNFDQTPARYDALIEAMDVFTATPLLP